MCTVSWNKSHGCRCSSWKYFAWFLLNSTLSEWDTGLWRRDRDGKCAHGWPQSRRGGSRRCNRAIVGPIVLMYERNNRWHWERAVPNAFHLEHELWFQFDTVRHRNGWWWAPLAGHQHRAHRAAGRIHFRYWSVEVDSMGLYLNVGPRWSDSHWLQLDSVPHVRDVLTLVHLSAQRLVHEFDLILHYWTLSKKDSVFKYFIERRTDHLKWRWWWRGRQRERDPSTISIVDISSNRKERACRRQSRNTFCQANAIKAQIEREDLITSRRSSLQTTAESTDSWSSRRNFQMKSFSKKIIDIYVSIDPSTCKQEEENDSVRERHT